MSYYNRSGNPINRYISEKIRLKRYDSDLTLREVSDKLGLGIQAIQKIETGCSTVMAMDLVKFANIFGVSINCFFAGCPELKGVGQELCFSKSQIDMTKLRLQSDINQVNNTFNALFG